MLLLSVDTVVTDWNDTLAPTFRRDVNYYVPCYLMAFPPYRKSKLEESYCPVAVDTVSTAQAQGYLCAWQC